MVLGTALFVTLIPLERRAVEQTAADQVGILAEAVASAYAVVDEVQRTHHAERVIEQVSSAPTVAFVETLDHRGKVAISSEPSHVGKLVKASPRLRHAELNGELLVVTQALPWTRSCVGCHEAAHDPVGTVRVAVARQDAIKNLETFHLWGGIGVAAVFAVLALIALWFADRFVSRPVFSLARVMTKAEHGDFLVRARIVSDEELGALGRAFNSMLKNITALKAVDLEREADLRQAHAELELTTKLAETAEALQASNAELEKRVKAQGLLMEAAHRLGSTLSADALLDRLVDLVDQSFELHDVAIFLIETDTDGEAVLRPARTKGLAHSDAFANAAIGVGAGLTGFVAETGAPAFLDDVSAPDARPGPERSVLPGGGSVLAVPMLHKGRVLGVIDFFSEKTHAFDEDDVALLQALAAQAAMAVVNADLYEKTVELSITDPLTGLLNRRALQRRLEIDIVRAQRFNHSLCLLMIDVDHFKSYNDRMGHLLGDEALKAIAATLEGTVRKVDAVARFGGEEFCVFLPRADEEAGADVARKLADAVRTLDLPGAEKQPLGHLSISVGLAVYPTDLPPALDGSTGQVLLDLADRAVYAAKSQGRDRLVTASELSKSGTKPPLDAPRPPASPAQGDPPTDDD